MTALFSTRRRAEEFAAAVDGAAGAGQRHRDLNDELRELVAVAGALRSPELHSGDAVPRADFSADLRSRLMTEAEHVLTPGNAQLRLPVRERGRRERRLVAAATAAVLLGGSAGMAAAAQQALPGEALYPIKRGLEQAEAELSMSAGGKGLDLLHHAADRLSEVRALLAEDSATAAPQVPETIEDFTSQAREGADLLMADYEETRDPANIVEVREFTADAIKVIRDLAPAAPEEAQDELAEAALALEEIDEAAIRLCGTCAQDIPALSVPEFLLAASEVDRALAKLDSGQLDNSHPVEVDKQLLEKAGQLAGGGDQTQQGDDSGSQQDGSAAGTPGLPLPGGTGGDAGGQTGDQDGGGLLGQLGDQLGNLGGDSESGTDSGGGDSSNGGGGGGLVEDTTDQLDDATGGLTGSVTDPLTDTVETILPDPGSDDGVGGLLP